MRELDELHAEPVRRPQRRSHVDHDRASASVAARGPLTPDGAMALQRLAGNAAVAQRVEEEQSPVLDVVGKGGGSPLPDATRVQMESALGADFSSVRLHQGGSAASSAAAVGASAYTVGDDVVLGSSVDPGSSAGQQTLAHELTHVVQQRSGPVSGTDVGGGIAVSDPGDAFERQAEATAEAVVSRQVGDPLVQREEEPAAGTGAPVLQREAEEEEEEELRM